VREGIEMANRPAVRDCEKDQHMVKAFLLLGECRAHKWMDSLLRRQERNLKMADGQRGGKKAGECRAQDRP